MDADQERLAPLVEALGKFFEGVRSLNREEFQLERLRSYYLAHSDLMVRPTWALAEARKLELVSPSAACVLASAAAELVLKEALLRPLVHGLVHHEAFAEYVTSLALGHTAIDRFDNLLVELIREFARIDLKPSEGPTTTLWVEMKSDRKVRNDVVHKGIPATAKEAGAAIRTTVALLDMVLGPVFTRLGLTAGVDAMIVESLSAMDLVSQDRTS